jgi:glycosyltransferase involved in cell wall biosynthesis
MRLGFVVPRYGAEIVGGAETLARSFAEHLPRDRFEIEILTTCATDHHTWANVLEPGTEREDGLWIRRFPVSPRNVGQFLAIQERISEGVDVGVEEELKWAAGSVNSEELYRYLRSESRRYSALLFLPYLFGTTLLGAQVDLERSVLIPCLHDEPFAYTRMVAHLFGSVRGILFNSAPERTLARRLFGVGGESPVVGLGFDVPGPLDGEVESFRRRHEIDGDYLLYFGRKEGGKNLPLLLEHFRAVPGAGDDLFLVAAGDGSIDPSVKSAGVVDLPRLGELEKRAACAGALALCQPSTNESFSIVLMEAWLEGTPVLVNSRCPVTRSHVEAANGGLHFANSREFAGAVCFLRKHRAEAAALGRQGREYVMHNYSWNQVLSRFEDGLREVLEASDR